jgi:hypothetical protein
VILLAAGVDCGSVRFIIGDSAGIVAGCGVVMRGGMRSALTTLIDNRERSVWWYLI